MIFCIFDGTTVCKHFLCSQSSRSNSLVTAETALNDMCKLDFKRFVGTGVFILEFDCRRFFPALSKPTVVRSANGILLDAFLR